MTTKKDGRGSGSKEKVGRKKLTYIPKIVYKKVHPDIYDICLSVINSEIQKFKLKNKN